MSIPAPASLPSRSAAASATWTTSSSIPGPNAEMSAPVASSARKMRPIAAAARRIVEDAKALEAAARQYAKQIKTIHFGQFVFFTQWHELRDYAKSLNIKLFGDVPIYVSMDSADAWAHPEILRIDPDGRPDAVAGVPPDYFSEDGQLWGNPLYDWDRHAADGYSWWVDRLRATAELADFVRIDHFRGFEAYWEIDAHAETAVDGRWVKGPGDSFFQALTAELGELPLVAEDLGVITPEVTALRERFGLPGMKILQFAFDGSPDNPYLPHNHETMSVVYTGTHDNNTTLGWYQELSDDQRWPVHHYLGADSEPMPWLLIRAALASVARLAVIPMQDLLGLDGSHRMNVPGVADGNWRWRFAWDQVQEEQRARLRDWVHLYGRVP